MNYLMPQLSYPQDSLEPIISHETIDIHYGKHLQTHINNLTNLVKGTSLEGKTVEEIIKIASDGPIINNAGLILNHTLYFLQFTPLPKYAEPKRKLSENIVRDFGSIKEMRNIIEETAINLFGSGWVWLSLDSNNKLHITKEINENNPLRNNMKPLLGYDVWEHAYYLDYQNNRASHIKKLWDIIDWTIVEQRM